MTGINDSCKPVEELLSAYRDNELSSEERQAVDGHLMTCAYCRAELQAVDRVARALKSLPAAELGRDMADDIERLIAGSEAARSESATAQSGKDEEKVVPFARPGRAFALGLVAAAVALIVAVGSFQSANNVAPVVADRHPEANQQQQISDPPEKIAKPAQPASDNSQNQLATSQSDRLAPQNDSLKPAEKLRDPGRSTAVAQTADSNVSQNGQPENRLAQKSRANSLLKLRQQSPATINYDDLSDDEAVIAFQEDDSNIFDGIGVATDEDGLYAIKM